MWKWFLKWFWPFISDESGQHVFEPAISLREDDGVLGVMRCMKCGYCTYSGTLERDDPPCVWRAHKWRPVKVFQWEHLALANKLPRPLECALCGAHASTHADYEKFGCSGHRQEED